MNKLKNLTFQNLLTGEQKGILPNLYIGKNNFKMVLHREDKKPSITSYASYSFFNNIFSQKCATSNFFLIKKSFVPRI